MQDTFHMIIHCGCYVVNGYNEPLLHKILLPHTHTKRVVYIRVYSTSTSHIWAQDKPLSIHKWGYQVCFTLNVWVSTHHHTLSWDTTADWSMTLQFSEKCSTWTAWDVPSCGGQSVLQYDRAAAGSAVLQCNTPQQISRCGQLTAWPHLMPVDAFRVRTPKEAYLCSPSKDYWHLWQLWQWLKPRYYGVLERMPCGTLSSVLK